MDEDSDVPRAGGVAGRRAVGSAPRFRRRRLRPLAVAGTAAVGFVIAVAVLARSPSPEARLPRNYRLAGLIERQQRETADLRRQVQALRRQVQALSTAAVGRQQGATERRADLDAALLA